MGYLSIVIAVVKFQCLNSQPGFQDVLNLDGKTTFVVVKFDVISMEDEVHTCFLVLKWKEIPWLNCPKWRDQDFLFFSSVLYAIRSIIDWILYVLLARGRWEKKDIILPRLCLQISINSNFSFRVYDIFFIVHKPYVYQPSAPMVELNISCILSFFSLSFPCSFLLS